MTKRDLMEAVAERYPQFSPHKIKTIVDAVFAAMTQALATGERIEVRRFGSFSLKSRTARTARNPKTGAGVAVGAKRVPFLKVSKELRQRVDREAPAGTSKPPKGEIVNGHDQRGEQDDSSYYATEEEKQL